MSPKATQPQQPDPEPVTGHGAGLSLRRMLSRRVVRLPIGGWLAIVGVTALIGTAYAVGAPPNAAPQPTTTEARFALNPRLAAGVPVPGATAMPISEPATLTDGSSKEFFNGGSGAQAAGVAQPQIVKTGSMTVQVTNLDNALAQAESSIVGLGGSVSSANQNGSGEGASAQVTYRIPVARWNDALKAMRGLGKLISQQTGSNDVTAQVVDLNARLDNLKVTEQALQGIMAKASAVPDILAVEQQLSNVQGEIEQLTAQRDYLANQAAMSTLSVYFVLPNQTVTVQATNEWTLGSQVDEAVAALVRIGQGLATLAVWLVIVGLPVIVVLLVLYVIYRIFRRLRRRTSGALTAA